VMVVPTPATLQQALVGAGYAALTAPMPAAVDSDGRFTLRLNQGTWDIVIVPPADSMLPRQWLGSMLVMGDAELPPVWMPRGVVVHGLVLAAADEAPISGADVRLYTIVDSNAQCAAGDSSCLSPPRLRAEGSSHTDGDVPFILPNQPQ